MSRLTLVLGSKNYSSWSMRAWLVLRQAGAAFDEVVIPLGRPDTADRIARYSPAGRVPALVDGPLTVWDSLAIAEYVAERFPGARLWPEDAAARAVARAVSAEMHAGFAELRSNLPFNVRRRATPSGRVAAAQADIARITRSWADCRARFGGSGPYLFGAFSIADAMYAPVVLRFVTYGVALEGPAAEWAEAIRALPAVKEWVAAAEAEPGVIAKYDAA